MKKHAFLLCFFLYNLILSQNQIIVGPQNDCALKNIKKNVHTSSEWFDVTGVTKLKIITLQHRTYDKSRIYNENGVLIWEWNGESYSDTWYRKEHYLDINTYKIKVEFTQGYNDPFCNGFVQVEKVVFNKLNNNIQNNNITSFTKESSQKRDEIYNLNGSKFEDFSNKYNIINSVNSSFSGKKSPYPSNPSESFYKKDYYNNKLIYEGYIKVVTTGSNNNTVYKEQFKHGKGKEYFSDANGYLEGYFINNKLNGYGEHFSDGFSYKGYFVNGERDGEGILVNDGLNGTSKYIYEGEFKNNKFHGKGIYLNETLAYVGEFSYGKFNGYGELKHSHNNGVIQKGFFENGNYIGEQLQITQNESNLSNNNNVKNSNSTIKNENKSSLNYVEIGDLFIQNADLGIMNYYQVKNSLASIGDGWRLPNESELIIMFQNRDKIGGLTTSTKTVNKHLVASYLGGPSGALEAYNTPLITNQEAAMFGKTYQTSWSEHSKQNFYFYIRLVKDKPQKNYTENAIKAYVELVNFANKNGISLSNESKTGTWQCNECGSVAHKKEKPWSKFGGKCTSNNVGAHTWEMAEKQVHWQCNECGSVAHKKEKPWSKFGGKCTSNNVGTHTWERAE